MNDNNIGFIINPAENFYARKGSIRLFLGCDQTLSQVDIFLTEYGVDNWDFTRISNLAVVPKAITGVRLGPRTVVELFREDNFSGNKRVIENESFSDTKTVDIGCVQDDPFWLGAVRSFKLYDYAYWYSLHSIRYCDNDSNCQWNERCLCRNGCEDPAWCKESKKRCLPMARYLQCRPPSVAPLTMVKKSCLEEQLNDNKNSFVPFKDIKSMSNRCFGPDVSNDVYTFFNYNANMKEAFCGSCTNTPFNPYKREHFTVTSNNRLNVVIQIVVVVLILLVLQKVLLN